MYYWGPIPWLYIENLSKIHFYDELQIYALKLQRVFMYPVMGLGYTTSGEQKNLLLFNPHVHFSKLFPLPYNYCYLFINKLNIVSTLNYYYSTCLHLTFNYAHIKRFPRPFLPLFIYTFSSSSLFSVSNTFSYNVTAPLPPLAVTVAVVDVTGYTITRCHDNAHFNSLGPYALAGQSRQGTFSGIRLLLCNVADGNGDCTAISHLYNLRWNWGK